MSAHDAAQDRGVSTPGVICCNTQNTAKHIKRVIDPVVVSENCSYVKQGAQVIAYCRQPEDPWYFKYLPQGTSVLLSLAALVLAVISFFYTRSKDGRARRQSIHDEFWLRKVVSPISIEPFLEFVQETNRDLPTAATNKPDVESYYKEWTNKFSDMKMSFSVLNLIDATLDKNVDDALSSYEDALNVYIGRLLAYLDNSSPISPTRNEAATSLMQCALGVLKPIQEHQLTVGDSK